MPVSHQGIGADGERIRRDVPDTLLGDATGRVTVADVETAGSQATNASDRALSPGRVRSSIERPEKSLLYGALGD